MKITKEYLKKIIKEELSSINENSLTAFYRLIPDNHRHILDIISWFNETDKYKSKGWSAHITPPTKDKYAI